MLPDILSKFVANNQDYHLLILKPIYKLDEMLQYIAKYSKINNEVNHAYIMKLALKYIDSKIPKPETPKYEQISIFDDGSTLW